MKKPVRMADHDVIGVFPANIRDEIIDWGLNEIGAPKVWEKSNGQGIRVAILDTGVDFRHPDLQGRIGSIADFAKSAYGGNDKQGHGTHCAGIVAANNNGKGMIGVAPEAELYCAKVLSDNGAGSFESIIQGLQWAIDKKVHIISMSIGSEIEPPQEFYDAIKAAHAAGIVMVAATGNQNKGINWPALYNEVIAISAMNRNHERASFSNYGTKNEIMAPGVDILSCYKEGGYARLSGTSMATPIVAGCIALYLGYLLKQGQPMPALEQLHEKLIQSCIDLGDKGKDDYFGYGLINLEKLLA